MPKNEFYVMRVYFNEKKERLAYYFDVSKGNEIDEESKIPYYDDLYIDVTMDNNNIKVLDEDELQFALETKKITKEEYNLANKIKDKLLNEIKNNTNKYINLDLEKYL